MFRTKYSPSETVRKSVKSKISDLRNDISIKSTFIQIQNMKKEILEFAQSQIGQTEIPGNLGFNDKRFSNIMRQNDFDPLDAWCAIFTKACYSTPTYPGKSKYYPHIMRLFTKGVMQTYNNVKSDNSGLFEITKEPEQSAVIILQNYKNGSPNWTGHAGIVEKYENGEIFTIEGNTNSKGGREGFEVARMKRELDFTKKTGLVLVGFIRVK